MVNFRSSKDDSIYFDECITQHVIFFPFSEVLTYSVGIIKPDDVLAGRVEEIKKKVERIL